MGLEGYNFNELVISLMGQHKYDVTFSNIYRVGFQRGVGVRATSVAVGKARGLLVDVVRGTAA